MRNKLVVVMLLLFCFEVSASAASPGWRYRYRRARSQYSTQRRGNYRYYNYQRPAANQTRLSTAKDPWWMSEPGLRSPRTRTLLEFSGYPYAFD